MKRVLVMRVNARVQRRQIRTAGVTSDWNALSAATLDVALEVVQDRLPSIPLLLLGILFLRIERNLDVDPLWRFGELNPGCSTSK